MPIHMLVCVGLFAPFVYFLPLSELLNLSLVLPSALGCIPWWWPGNAFAQPVCDRVLASSRALLRQQHCRAGPGYLLLATLD